MTTTYMAQSGTRVGRQRERISMPKTAPFLEENLKRGTVHYSIAALPNSNMNHKCNFEFPSSHMGKVKKKKKKKEKLTHLIPTHTKYHFNMLSIQKIIDILFHSFFLYRVTKIECAFYS